MGRKFSHTKEEMLTIIQEVKDAPRGCRNEVYMKYCISDALYHQWRKKLEKELNNFVKLDIGESTYTHIDEKEKMDKVDSDFIGELLNESKILEEKYGKESTKLIGYGRHIPLHERIIEKKSIFTRVEVENLLEEQIAEVAEYVHQMADKYNVSSRTVNMWICRTPKIEF